MGGRVGKTITAETAEGAEMIGVNDLPEHLRVLCALCGEYITAIRPGEPVTWAIRIQPVVRS